MCVEEGSEEMEECSAGGECEVAGDVEEWRVVFI